MLIPRHTSGTGIANPAPNTHNPPVPRFHGEAKRHARVRDVVAGWQKSKEKKTEPDFWRVCAPESAATAPCSLQTATDQHLGLTERVHATASVAHRAITTHRKCPVSTCIVSEVAPSKASNSSVLFVHHSKPSPGGHHPLSPDSQPNNTNPVSRFLEPRLSIISCYHYASFPIRPAWGLPVNNLLTFDFLPVGDRILVYNISLGVASNKAMPPVPNALSVRLSRSPLWSADGSFGIAGPINIRRYELRIIKFHGRRRAAHSHWRVPMKPAQSPLMHSTLCPVPRDWVLTYMSKQDNLQSAICILKQYTPLHNQRTRNVRPYAAISSVSHHQIGVALLARRGGSDPFLSDISFGTRAWYESLSTTFFVYLQLMPFWSPSSEGKPSRSLHEPRQRNKEHHKQEEAVLVSADTALTGIDLGVTLPAVSTAPGSALPVSSAGL
ncbi:uncharacterized protein CLUP02_03301 [Colletotrichum lupini]|uniref:Uncharacterized protein n=1 Tax=Colletotrichum lupini TaxID=145971 RepID=A0A9Q8SJ02_9PEZI|nr:uncharacterized protein CLUP02_03301 [Colletotrichum lupini]UQC77830.1 hypothetical protein CLUP02_03301 [Colletotrichum lupini]